jgi:acetyltransferase EpsM
LKTEIIIYGASGHGKVVMDAILSQGNEVNCFVDDDLLITNFVGLTVINKTEPSNLYVIAVGNNATRMKISQLVRGDFAQPVIHNSAIVSDAVEIGIGSVVFAAAIINHSAVIGTHVIINTAAVVEHDCIIDSFAHISPNATLCGNVRVGEGTHIGAGAVILPNLTIGKWCTIGAGAVIITNIPDGATVVGNPGKIIKITDA